MHTIRQKNVQLENIIFQLTASTEKAFSFRNRSEGEERAESTRFKRIKHFFLHFQISINSIILFYFFHKYLCKKFILFTAYRQSKNKLKLTIKICGRRNLNGFILEVSPIL